MNFKKYLLVLILVIVLITTPVLLFIAYTHTFSNFLTDETDLIVFYPQGLSDKYECIITNGNEDHRIWQYELNDEETEALEDEVSSGKWQKVSPDECKYIIKAYFENEYFEYAQSDKVYYCLYDLDNDIYKNISTDDTLLYGQKNLLLVYNATESDYYCAAKIS